jgi:hypothetical protein
MQLIINKTDDNYTLENPPGAWAMLPSVEIIIILETISVPERIDENLAFAKEPSIQYHKTIYRGQIKYKKVHKMDPKEHTIEIEKKGDLYIVKNVPLNMPDRFFVNIEEPQRQKHKSMKDKTYWELKSLAEKYPDDKLLQTKLEYYSPYPNVSEYSDDDILFLALKEKYDL